MEIEESALYSEILDIINSGAKPVHATWNANIIANDVTIRPLKLISIDYLRDYMANYTDYIMVEMLILKGTFAKRIYPFINNLEIEIVCQPIKEQSDSEDESGSNATETYVAVMFDEGNPVIEQSTRNTASEEEMNLSGWVEAKFMLFNKSTYKLQMMTCGGTYRDMTGEALVKALLTKYSRAVKVDEDRKIKGVEMVTASNQDKRDHLVIPPGTPVVNLPHHIHYNCGGLYSAGLGYYLQDDYWYLFPCYDTTRFNDVQKTLTIIIVPPNRFPGLDRTYRLDGDNLVIIATGEAKYNDRSNQAQLNRGNGVRFADANKMMDGFAKVEGNKAVASRGSNNTEMVSENRVDGQNNVRLGKNPITANPYLEYSALAARQGSPLTVTWENANRSLLYPGMPTKVMYLDGDQQRELAGVLLSVHSYVSLKEPGLNSTRYTNNTMLGVFVTPQDRDYVEDDPV